MRLKRKTIGLIITHDCNLDCIYCYENNKNSGYTMSVSEAKKIIEASFSTNQNICDEIEFDFMGGEPLIKFELMKEVAEWMWSRGWSKPYILFATTNGTLINKEMKKWFYENRERFVLGLSYDGDTSMQNLNRNNSANLIDVHFFTRTWSFQPVKMTISRETLSNLSNGIQNLHSLGFKDIHANLAYGIDWQTNDLNIYKEQLADLVEFYLKNTNLKASSLLDVDITQILYQRQDAKYCGAGTGLHYYDIDGSQYPCHWFTPLVLNDSELEKVKQLDFNKESSFIRKKCIRCRLINVCPTCYGMNFKEFGNLQERSSWYCSAFIEQFLANCRLQANILNRRNEPLDLNDKIKIHTINKVSKSLIYKNLSHATV